MKNVDCSIIIPNYNGAILLKKNLPRLSKSKENSKNRIAEVIIVDNGSTDDSVAFIKKNYPEIRLIKFQENKGFSKAINVGVKESKGNLVLLLNNDVAVSNNFLEPVYKHFEDPKVFGVSLHEKGFGWAKGKFKDGYILHESGKEPNKPHDTFWVAGSSGLFRKSIWEELSGLDEELLSPFYWEDIDISYRASKRGYKLVWEPNAKVVHKQASTASTQISKGYLQRVQQRNQLLFIWKNLASERMIRKHYSGLFRRILKNPGYIRILLMALVRMPVIINKRRVEKKECTVSDEAVIERI